MVEFSLETLSGSAPDAFPQPPGKVELVLRTIYHINVIIKDYYFKICFCMNAFVAHILFRVFEEFGLFRTSFDLTE